MTAGEDETGQAASANTIAQYLAKCTKWSKEEDTEALGEVSFGM